MILAIRDQWVKRNESEFVDKVRLRRAILRCDDNIAVWCDPPKQPILTFDEDGDVAEAQYPELTPDEEFEACCHWVAKED